MTTERKIKENEKRLKHLDLARELRTLWNRKVTVIPIITGALGTIPKDLECRLKELGLRRRIGIFEPTASV